MNYKNFTYFGLFLVAFPMLSCSPSVWQSENFEKAFESHKVVAILPADVSIQLRPKDARNTSYAQLKDMSKKAGYDFQEKMYGWLLSKSNRFHYTVSFQDITKTNAKLAEAGIGYEDLRNKDRQELARLLETDAVIQTNVNSEKPMSDGGAVALGLLVGVWGTTNKTRAAVNIHDGETGDLLWKYDYQVSGSVGSSTSSLSDALMRNMSKHFPYKMKK